MTTLYYSHPDFLNHDTRIGHPECADRLKAIEQKLSGPQFSGLIRVHPRLAEDVLDKISLIHSPKMIAEIMAAFPLQGYVYLDADTVVSAGSKQAALLAVSAACDAVDMVVTGDADNAFCAVRPPGHHAEPDHAMGFCVFNNIAIATEHARTHHHLQKIAIIDFDVHHGNGTQKAFINQPQVLYASSHQWPYYPGSGASTECGVGNIINLPLPAYTSGAQLRAKYQEIIFPALKAFHPQLILISAGFDAHRQDPLASLSLQDEDYLWLTQQIMAIAEQCCQGRIVSLLEGGYDLTVLANCVAIHVGCLAGIASQ